MIRTSLLVACCLTVLAASAASANHSELEWYTVDTEHFIVHYHTGADETARMAAEIAEAIYPRITGLYDFEPPSRTHIVLADYEDYANGAAYFFDGKFEIWATNLEFDLRGTTQWLWNVITHEFVHMINIQASQRTPRNIPAIYFQWFDYEDERRTDVLTGYPNRLVSYPFSSVVVPAWFAEGSAQYMAADTHHDFWDAHRDMILRMAALDDALLSYNELSLFKGSLAAEQVYDHGFSLVRYIVEEHGDASLRRIIEAMRSPLRLSANGAFEAATGVSGHDLYDGWKAETVAKAQAEAKAVEARKATGRPLGTIGTYNTRPVWSPDGKRLAWLSNTGGDYHRTALVWRSVDPADSTDADTDVLMAGVVGNVSFSPDGKTIYYAKRATKDRFGSLFFDLYAYDVESEEETRLTKGARLRDPAVSPDGTRLAAVRNQDGTNDVVLVSLPAEEEKAEVTVLTESPFGRQYYAPVWHPDGSHLLVDTFDTGRALDPTITRDIVRLAPHEGATPVPVVETPADDRLPVYASGGERIVYAADGSAAGFRKFDLFERDVTTGVTRQLTNVVGGAFYPAVSPDGRTIAYAAYTSDGYRIYLLPRSEALDEPVSDFPALTREPTTVSRTPIEEWEETPYRGRFARFLWSPRVVIDEGRLKLGVYASTNDVLDKQSIFGGAAYGQRGDLDAFLLYENRFFWPTLFAEAFWVRKHRTDTSYSKLEGLERRWDLDLRYDAFEIDAGVRLEAGSPFSPFFYSALEARFRHSRNHLNLRVSKLTPSDDLIGTGDVLILPKDGWDYYRGYDVILSYSRRSAARATDAEINPVGREWSIAYTYSRNDLSTSGNQEVDASGVIRTVFDDNTFHQVEGSVSERRSLPWGRHTLDLHVSGGWIDRNIDDFFWFRIGSRPGLRGYTYYSLEGRAYAIGRATYRFPIWSNIDRRLFQFVFERLYGGVFYEAGLAWQRPVWDHVTMDQIVRDRVRDVGFEVRLDLLNFDTFPARVHFEGAYPIDRVVIPTAVANAADDEVVRTDRDWRFYFGVLFGY